MKNLLLFIAILFCATISFAQTFPNTTTQGNVGTLTNFPGAVGSAIKLRQFTDTTAANLVPYLRFTPHLLIKVGNNIYVRNTAATAWVLIGGNIVITPGVDSVTLYGNLLCQWVGGVSTCYSLSNSGTSSYSFSGDFIYDSLLNFHSTVYQYYILGRYFTSPYTLFTLSPSNPSADRVDVFYTDTLSQAGIRQGLNGGGKRSVNPVSELENAIIEIQADSIIPANFSNTDIYINNGVNDWQATSNIVGFNPAYATNPYGGSGFSVLVPAFGNDSSLSFKTNGSKSILNTFYLKFRLRLLSSFSAANLNFSFFFGGASVSSVVPLLNGQGGYNSATINSWQEVNMRFSNWQFTYNEIDSLLIGLTGSNASGFQIDQIQLQDGGGTSSAQYIEKINGIGGRYVNLPIGDSLRYNADTSLLHLIDSHTGTILGSVPSLLSYLNSSDTCIVIDTTGMAATKNVYISLNPYCVGGGGATYTASNGLTMSSNDTKLGGALTASTTIAAGASYQLNITGSNASQLLYATNTNATSGEAITGVSTGTFGTGVLGSSSTWYGVYGSTGGTSAAIYARTQGGTTSGVNTGILIEKVKSPGANGIGVSVDFQNSTSSSSAKSNSLISKWSNATHAARTSEFVLTGVSSAVTADLLTISGSGSTRLNKYGIGTFTGTPAYNLQVDASGNIIEGPHTQWLITGNANTTAANFLGPTDRDSFLIATQSDRGMFIDNALNNYSIGAGLSSISSGTGNVGIANGALRAIDGSLNTAVGSDAGRNATTGSNNTIVGSNAAARTVLDAEVTNFSNSTYIGALIQNTNATGNSYEMALGAGAIAEGANTTVIGSDGHTTSTKLLGQLKLPLYVSGTVPTGTPTYALQVDASGNVIGGSVGGGGVAWGAITGTLSSQTDLQTQLTDKASLTTANIFTTNGAVSTSANKLNGTWYSGGSATTTKPYLLIEPSGTTSTAWSTNGTGLGINAASGFAGNLIDLKTNNTSVFTTTNNGSTTIAGGVFISDNTIYRNSNSSLFTIASSATTNTKFIMYGITHATLANIITVTNAATETARFTATNNLLIGTTTDIASSKLTVNSTTQGFLPPRMTATQASAIGTPAEGLMVYVTDTNGTFTAKGWWGYNGAAWEKLNN